MTIRIPRRPQIALVSMVATCALALTAAGCSGPGATAGDAAREPAERVSQADIDKAMTTPTKLTFWTWVPDIEKEVELFEKAYPAIDVEVVNAGTGGAQYQKIRTAIKAGKGVPDVVQMEFHFIPTFTITDDLLDLSPYLPENSKDLYPAWIWDQISRDNAVYAVPQDSGPMGMVYRDDILKKHSVDPPKTWEEFATLAKKLHEEDPEVFGTNLLGNDAGQIMGLLWQAGIRPFAYDGEKTVSVDLTSPEATKFWTYWSELLASGSISVDPGNTDQWYQSIANGKYATWITAAWGPVFLQGTAQKTSGLWRAGPLPQWSASESASGNYGGSSSAVIASTKNPIAAAEFSRWINSEHDSALMLANEQFLFPTTNEILNDPAFIEQKAEFYGGQQVNKEFVEISSTVDTGFQWLPFMEYVYSSFNDTLGTAISKKTDLNAGAKAWQDQIVSYAKQQGFTVK